MNLLLGISFMLFGLLLLVSQAQLTVGSDGVHHSGNANGNQHARKRAAALAKGAQLFIETESGATLTRAARGTNDAGNNNNNNAGGEADTVAAAAGAAEAAGTPTKRTKNNRKSNKNFMGENVGHAGGRKHNEKRLHNGNGQQQQQQPLLQHGGNRSGNNNNNHKQQRQMLKSRQQQQQQGGEELPIAHTRKRSGGKSKQNGENAEKADKNTNGAKSPSTCRYAKSAWSECDAKTNMRSRTLTLKKGESNCLPTRTMQKKCKKACRYEKGSWSECSAGQMTRQDKLKSTGGTSPSPLEVNCDAVRTINKKCNPGGGNGGGNNKQHSRNNKERKHKDKAGRRNTRQD